MSATGDREFWVRRIDYCAQEAEAAERDGDADGVHIWRDAVKNAQRMELQARRNLLAAK